MPTIPTYDLPQVGSRALGAPQIRTVAPVDNSAALVQAAGDAAMSIGNAVQRQRESADTAALMEAEARLSQSKLDMMFSPETGVYSKKGKNALNVTNEYLPAFDKTVDEIGSSLTNDQQRLRFSQIANSQRQQLNGELNRYEHAEREVYFDNSDKANLATSIEGATKYAGDPGMVAYYQAKGNAVLGSMARRNGIPPEQFEQQRLEYNSKLEASVITQMAGEDPLKAQQYYAKAAPNMTVDDSAAINKLLGTSVRKQMASGIADSLWTSGGLGDKALTALIIQAESGGDPSAVSPKGARGLMQLMPDTAKEVSEELGIPYDEQRLTTDPQYNATLGTAYINKMLGRYDGNQALALAAYNAGPGKVDEWLKENGDPRSGEVTVAEWVNKIPFDETRNYTAKILNQAAVGEPASQKYADGLKAVNAIKDPELAKFVKDNLDNFKKADEAQLAANYDQAAEYVADGGYQAIPDALLVTLPAAEKQKLREFDTKVRAGEQPRTDYDKFEQFLSMTPEKLAEISLAKDARPYLNDSDFKKVTTAWQAAQRGDGTVLGITKAEDQVVKRAMASAGIIVGDSMKAAAPDNLAQQDQFRAALQDRKDSFVAATGKQPTVMEVQDLAEQLTLEVRLTGGGTFFGDSDSVPLWQVMPEDLKKAYLDKGDFEIDKIPARDRREIVQSLRLQGRAASEANIIADYVNRISSLGVKVK